VRELTKKGGKVPIYFNVETKKEKEKKEKEKKANEIRKSKY
jgi:hypothetical protein